MLLVPYLVISYVLLSSFVLVEKNREHVYRIRVIVGIASSKLVPVGNLSSPRSSRVHTPCGPLKSLIPADVDICYCHWLM